MLLINENCESCPGSSRGRRQEVQYSGALALASQIMPDSSRLALVRPYLEFALCIAIILITFAEVM